MLRKHGVLDAWRDGTSVFYSVRDPRMFQLLDTARQIITSNLTESNRCSASSLQPTETRRADDRWRGALVVQGGLFARSCSGDVAVREHGVDAATTGHVTAWRRPVGVVLGTF